MDKATDKAKLLALKTGEVAHIFWFEEGGGEVHKLPGSYDLYDVPQYGGEPRFYANFPEGQEDQIVDVAWTWT